MNSYFRRVYHMKDGSKISPDAYYETEELAIEALPLFNPSGEGVDDMANVDYVTIEKRYSPTWVW